MSEIVRTLAQDPEWRAKQSASKIGKPLSSDHRANVAAANRRKADSPEWREKNAEGQRGRHHSPETRAKMAITNLPGIRRAIQASALANPSPAELLVRDFLDGLGILYIPAYSIGPYVADIFIPANQLVVECDGQWHHKSKAAAYDTKRDTYMRKKGFSVLRLPDSEINQGRAEKQILQTLGMEI